MESWEAERALGVWIAPNGNTQAEVQYRLEQANTWASQMMLHKASKYACWVNLNCVLLKKLEYPLMATTLSRQECDQIMRPVLKVTLPAIGLNHHFPWKMVYGHNDHHGLALLHLYDTQGFRHLMAVLQFGDMPSTTGQLLQHSYEALQLELGLPGEILQYPFAAWKDMVTPTWLTHTWQYASEHEIKIVSGQTSLKLLCMNNQFLNLAFWQHGFRGRTLMILNKCQMWLQVLTVAELVDGYGHLFLQTIFLGGNDIIA